MASIAARILLALARESGWLGGMNTRVLRSLATGLAVAAGLVSAPTMYSAEGSPAVRVSVGDEKTAFADVSALIDAKTPDLAQARAAITEFAQKFPDSRGTRILIYGYMDVVESRAPDRVRAEWESFTSFPNPTVAQLAKAKVRGMDLLAQPLDIAFKAADGRDVDLAKLRGKVVLIDFWATWCGPCVAEIPNVKRVYEQYHDKGFEIIGISFENARVTPADSVEVAAKKRDAAREKMLAFAAERAMTWPQHFDGKWWENEFGRRYAIMSIPAMFLVDQNGKVVSTNARGPKLESEVKRLLKQ